jgi:hypothetical protein
VRCVFAKTLRQIRTAIDEFKRDTIGACAAGTTNNPTPGPQGAAPADPRSRVVIDDCSIFDTENLDRYPPDLKTLVDGVKVRQRGINVGGNGGGVLATRTQPISTLEQKKS